MQTTREMADNFLESQKEIINSLQSASLPPIEAANRGAKRKVTICNIDIRINYNLLKLLYELIKLTQKFNILLLYD
jgi:hypothetical protein